VNRAEEFGWLFRALHDEESLRLALHRRLHGAGGVQL